MTFLQPFLLKSNPVQLAAYFRNLPADSLTPFGNSAYYTSTKFDKGVSDVYILKLNNSLYILLFLNLAKHILIWKLLPTKLRLNVSPGAESINCCHVCMHALLCFVLVA